MPLTVRPESRSDISAIHDLTKAAFLHAPHTAHTEHFIVDALRDANALFLSLVAEEDGAIVAHVALSPVSISDGESGWYGLGPISVHPQHQGKGIGSRLMLAALEKLKEKGAAGCVLVGDPGYYGRFGFKQQNGLVYPGIPAEYFLAISFSGPVPEGAVKFHEAFDTKAPA